MNGCKWIKQFKIWKLGRYPFNSNKLNKRMQERTEQKDKTKTVSIRLSSALIEELKTRSRN